MEELSQGDCGESETDISYSEKLNLTSSRKQLTNNIWYFLVLKITIFIIL